MSSSGSDSEVEQADLPPPSRPKTRISKPPKRYRDSDEAKQVQELEKMEDKRVSVKCNQTGRCYVVKVGVLSKDDTSQVLLEDLTEGNQLLMDFDKKSYPVTVEKVVPSGKTIAGKGKRNHPTSTAKGNKKILDAAKASFTASNESDDESDIVGSGPKKTKLSKKKVNLDTAKASFTASDSDDNDSGVATSDLTLLEEGIAIIDGGEEIVVSSDINHGLSLKISKIFDTVNQNKKKLDIIIKLLQKRRNSVEVDESTSTAYIINGVDLLNIPCRDPYSYGRNMLDILFSKQEQKNSVVIKSSKSLKQPLSPRRIKKLFDCVEKRYSDYDHKRLVATLGQKCRDAKTDPTMKKEDVGQKCKELEANKDIEQK